MPAAVRSLTGQGSWEERLSAVCDTMREMSDQTDPQAMVRRYVARMERFLPAERRIALSRRGLECPQYRITRYSGWEAEINPWKQPERLPLLRSGLLGRLIYADVPQIVDEIELAPDDPGREYLAGQRSLMAIPLYDQGHSLNMVVITRSQPAAFDRELFPEVVWMSNLFGRATQNLVLADQVREASAFVEKELQVVAGIQRSLLPARVPEIPGLRIAAHYQTSRSAGGDYYDFFPLNDGRWGLLIADVSGHGTPAAVMMAVTHAIAHSFPGPRQPPSRLLEFVNRQLSARYTGDSGTFVTAFYGCFDPETRRLEFSNAGHNPPRLRRASDGRVLAVEEARRLPLGVLESETYHDAAIDLAPGDQLVLYTDGVTEAESPRTELFGTVRLDEVVGRQRRDPETILEGILSEVRRFTLDAPAKDDRTLVVAKVV